VARKNPHAVALGRIGGSTSSPAKRRAARLNARKAGRKPKFEIGDLVIANDEAPGDYRGRRGRIKARIERAQYDVAFDTADGGHATGVLMSWWLDPATR
jgi:hypothetical protein